MRRLLLYRRSWEVTPLVPGMAPMPGGFATVDSKMWSVSFLHLPPWTRMLFMLLLLLFCGLEHLIVFGFKHAFLNQPFGKTSPFVILTIDRGDGHDVSG